MIRIICREQDVGAAAHCDGAKAVVSFRVFEHEVPMLEAWMNAKTGSYVEREIIGVEVCPDEGT